MEAEAEAEAEAKEEADAEEEKAPEDENLEDLKEEREDEWFYYSKNSDSLTRQWMKFLSSKSYWFKP